LRKESSKVHQPEYKSNLDFLVLVGPVHLLARQKALALDSEESAVVYNVACLYKIVDVDDLEGLTLFSLGHSPSAARSSSVRSVRRSLFEAGSQVPTNKHTVNDSIGVA